MGMRLLRAGLAFVAIASCQSPGAVDSTVYLSFFREVAHAHTIGTTGPGTSIQDVLGITDQEAQSVVDVSAGCGRAIDSLENDARALVFESRLRAANEEKPSEALAGRLKELDTKRVRTVWLPVPLR